MSIPENKLISDLVFHPFDYFIEPKFLMPREFLRSDKSGVIRDV